MDRLEKLKGPRQIGLILLCGACVAFSVWMVYSRLGNGVSETAYNRMYVDTETGKAFSHKVQVGDSWPIRSPYSGKNTGMPAEACFWTANGQIKKTPDWVALNEITGKPGPTFCPVCGRLVVAHNPAPRPGDRPPPTEAELAARQASGASAAGR